MRNKKLRIFLIIWLIAFTILPINITKAANKTLGDYKKEVAELEAKANRNKRLSQEAQYQT